MIKEVVGSLKHVLITEQLPIIPIQDFQLSLGQAINRDMEKVKHWRFSQARDDGEQSAA